MQFNSYLYIFYFLPLIFFLYSIFRTTGFAKIILLLASAFFYGCFAPVFLIPLVLSGIFDFFIAIRIAKGNDRLRRWLLFLSCIINLGLLAAFKYTNWLTGILHHLLLPYGINIPVTSIPLPPGISFYTFQTLCYVFAVYQMQFAPTEKFIDYMNYIMFFPQLVAGPIERAENLIPQISSVRPAVSARDASGAIFLILFGLFKKCVLADNFGSIVEFLDNHLAPTEVKPQPGLGLLFAYAFAGQIYCDFSAYSDIAIGSAKLFNVDLMKNFRTPYFAANPSEFWGGWHISLSTWLKEFVFTPICFALPGSGKRGQRWHILLALVITMFLCGLWHGAGVMFILWGLYHALLYVAYIVFPLDRHLKAWLGQAGRFLGVIIFFHLVCFGWILFRCQSFEKFQMVMTSIRRMYHMVGHFSEAWLYANWIFAVMGWGLFLLVTGMLLSDLTERWSGWDIAKLYHRLPSFISALAILCMIYGIIFFGRRVANEFIYFAF